MYGKISGNCCLWESSKLLSKENQYTVCTACRSLILYLGYYTHIRVWQAWRYCPAKKEGGQEGYQLILFDVVNNPMFFRGLFSCFRFKKRQLQSMGPKKVESLLMWSVPPESQRCVVTLCYSPCDDTTTPTGGESLIIWKSILFCFLVPYSPLRYTAIAILHLSLRLQWW